MKQYASRGVAGLVTRSKNLDSGSVISVYVAEQAGIDSVDPWVTVCETHGCMVSSHTQTLARASARSPQEWCEGCATDGDEMKHNGKTKTSDRIQLSSGQIMTLGEALDGGILYLKAVDNYPHKHPKYTAREHDNSLYWEIGQKLFESRGGEGRYPKRSPGGRHYKTLRVCEFCREDLEGTPEKRRKAVASLLRYERVPSACAGCGDVAEDEVVVDLDKRDLAPQEPGDRMNTNARYSVEHPFEQAKRERDVLETNLKVWSERLNAFPKSSVGLTSDAAKNTPEWREAKRQSDIAFRKLQEFNTWFTKMFSKELAAERRARRSQGITPNATSYHVWVVGVDDRPKDEGPYGPFALLQAEDFARIGATNGAHDRVVSVGSDPGAGGFRIVRRYRRGTGERVL